ncbi:hypothetical protein QJS10_CPB11g01000 [Acorus calamus]|uniref:Uncharacterized protein n=1 Tax=Acorus calamus TaxID=4465 RepID=A0AAV9DW20_ACOCL|nr:hypothetical protein QJS10_CPB11g01000 [Acorus calamus]
MQQDAFRLAGKGLDAFDITDSTEIARFIKKCGCFICFCIGSLTILLFKSSTTPDAGLGRFATFETVKA